MKISLITLMILMPIGSHAQSLEKRFEKILSSYSKSIKKDQVGLAVMELENHKKPLVYGHNEEREMTPASITKIATAAAVLERMGASAKLQTTLWSESLPVNGVLKGDLVLKGGGDSGFVSETMWFLVNELMRTGIKKIEGNIVVDDRDFDDVRTDSSRDPERVDRAYDAPVGAMSFNWNSISIFIRPSEPGKPPHVYLDPIDNGYKIDNKAKTTPSGGNGLQVQREGDRIYVRGTIGMNQSEVAVYKNIDDPVEWSGRNLAFFLAQRGVEFKGKIVSGKRTLSMKQLAKADSKPIAQAVSDMMKFSNNYVAEMLAKNLAQQKNPNQPATIEAGMKIIRDVLAEMGIKPERFNLINPSGLSRRNKARPVDLAQILVHSYRQFPTFAEYMTSFPLAGFDGTLKNRMKDKAGWVRGKTGLLNGVVGLAGYAGRKDGSVMAFAFIFNGRAEQGDSARRLFDALAMELVQ